MICIPKQTKTVMIIDSDPESLEFLSWELGGTYPVLPCASTGDVLEVAMEANPDAIIIVLSREGQEMPGDTLRKLRGDSNTSQVPVMLVVLAKEIEYTIPDGIPGSMSLSVIMGPVQPDALRNEVEKVMTSSCHI